MRSALAMIVVLSGMVVTAGCEAKRPEPPAGYVDPGTDPAAVGAELSPDLNEEAPK